jgi:hypothetical protein
MSPQTKILLGGLALGLGAFAFNVFLLVSPWMYHRYYPELAFLSPGMIVACGLGLLLRPQMAPAKTTLQGWVILVLAGVAAVLNTYLMGWTNFYEGLFSVSTSTH